MLLYAVIIGTLVVIAPPSRAIEPASESAASHDSRPARDLVLDGTVIEISQGADDLKPWVVAVTVDRVISGDFAGKTFEFAIHSPAKSGLEVGKSYTIKARWTGKGYTVDEHQWRRR